VPAMIARTPLSAESIDMPSTLAAANSLIGNAVRLPEVGSGRRRLSQVPEVMKAARM
jgi:hypothetical protein